MPVTAKPLDVLCREGTLLRSSQGRDVYAVTYEGIRAPMIVKHLSIPATQSMVSGLIFSGAVADEEAALAYYSTEMDELKKELAQLDQLRDHPHFLPYLDSQIKLKEDGVGYDVYLLTLRAATVRELMEQRAFTGRSALELGISTAKALCALRDFRLLHRNIKPENLYRDPNGVFRMGDLGVITLEDIPFATLPDRYISECTAPELCEVLGMHNETVDTYSIGAVLWTLFNGYVPFDEERRRAGEALPAPAHAAGPLAAVLCKACAPAPADRFASPAELLSALEGCLDETDDSPLPAPAADPKTDAEPENPTQSGGMETVIIDLPLHTEAESSEGTASASPEAEAPAESEAAATPSSSDEEVPDETSNEDPTAVSAESETTTTTPTDESTAVPDGADNTENADSREEPVEDRPTEVTYLEGATLARIDIPQQKPEFSAKARSAFAAAYEEEDDLSDVLTENPSRVKAHRRLWLKIAIPILVVALLASAAFGVWYYLENRSYLIEQLTLEIQGADVMRVSVQAPADAPLTVNLTDNSGRVLQSLPYTGEDLYFEDLDAGTEYIVNLQCNDDLKLEGTTSNRAVTPMPTEILLFEAEALSPTEIALRFIPTGYEPEHWTLTFSNADGDTQTSSFTGTELTIEGLDAGQDYTFTITDADNEPVQGIDTVSCETETVVNLTTFELDDSEYGQLTVRWASTGNYAKRWYLTCSGSDGSYLAEEITEQTDSFSHTFEELKTGYSYTVELSCDGLTNPDDATRSVDLPLCTVTDFVAYATGSDGINASWNFIDGEAPERWHLTCTNVGTGESQVYAVTENKLELRDLLPNAEYRLELSAEGDLLVGGAEPQSAVTKAADKFDDYYTSGIFLGFFSLPNKADWGLTDLTTSNRNFSTNGGMAFAVEVSYQFTAADKEVETLYIIRNSDGQVVNYATGSLSWSGASVKETHFGGFEQCPDKAGEYTLEIYFNRELLVAKTFNVY